MSVLTLRVAFKQPTGKTMSGRGNTLAIIEDLIAGGWTPDFQDGNLYVHPEDPDLTFLHVVEDDELIPSGKVMSLLRNAR